MVSSFPFNWETVHVGVTRRSVAKEGDLSPDVLFFSDATDMTTETSAGVAAKAIFCSFCFPRNSEKTSLRLSLFQRPDFPSTAAFLFPWFELNV